MKNQEKLILFVKNDIEDRLVTEYDTLIGSDPSIIIMASSLNEAGAEIKENTFLAVVSDFYLNDGICIDLIPELNGTPLIALVDEGGEDNALTALNAGAFTCIIKDKKKKYLNLLPIAINRSLEKRKQQAELANYRTQIENIIEERTNELIDLFGKLQESEINFRNIFNNTSDGMIITDYNFKFIEANEALLKQFDVTKDFLSSHSLIDYLIPAFRELIDKNKSLLAEGIASGNLEIEIRSPVNNKIIPFEINSVPIVFNQKDAILTVMRDITERRSLARKLFETIIQTEEEERSRFARDLHDEIGPLISALKIYTTSFIESNNPEKKDKIAGQIGSIIRDVIESVKNISNDMSPHVLVNFGLSAAIKNFIDFFSGNLKIILSTNISNMRFPALVESLNFRIIKELINNTVKHAKATHIFINLDYAETALVCHYRDDGIGFDWQQQLISHGKGMGISNIISRIQSLGGEFEIQSEPGHGFEINFVFKTTLKDATNQ
jgi:PAS domain S-box-containing protein